MPEVHRGRGGIWPLREVRVYAYVAKVRYFGNRNQSIKADQTQ